jgi:8-amino-7-oxononanoate synthase
MREIVGKIGKKTLVRNPQNGKVEDLLMLGSNNYQDLSNHPHVVDSVIKAILEFGVGCGGPQLLNGNTDLHIKLQKKLAQSKGLEDCILFGTGYAANVGWTTALLSENDWLVYDIQSHGSLYDGIKMGDFKHTPFFHNDCESLKKRLSKIRDTDKKATIIVCVEGVYSMDGDVAPLVQIRKVCDQFNALLCIDDAHGSGVMGESGHGTQSHFGLNGLVDLCMGTFSKAYSVTGGYVTGKKYLIDYMRVNARSHLFSASLPPSTCAAVIAGMEVLEQEPERIAKLHENSSYMAKKLTEAGFKASTESAIIPILIPQEFSMRDLVVALHQEGLFVNGIEYPSVPRSRQRLRISMMSTFTKEEIDFAVEKMIKVGKQFGVLSVQ